MQKILIALMAFTVTSAQAAPVESWVKIYKAKGSLQCEPNTGTSPQAMRKELEKAGIHVQSATCGIDGLMHAAVCGGEDGAITIFEIPASQAAQTAKLGFKGLASLPDAKEIPCP